jgi:hypothetical protein
MDPGRGLQASLVSAKREAGEMMGRHRAQALGLTRTRASVLLALSNHPGGAGLITATALSSLALGARSAGRTEVAV